MRLSHPQPVRIGGWLSSTQYMPRVRTASGELLEIHRLRDVTIDPQAVTVDDIPLFTGGGQDHHRDHACAGIRLDPLQHFQPVHQGQFRGRAGSLWGAA